MLILFVRSVIITLESQGYLIRFLLGVLDIIILPLKLWLLHFLFIRVSIVFF
jgi:hypothetical protein